jgi:hypothetical protein
MGSCARIHAVGAAFAATLASSKAEVRDESPSYERSVFGRSGFSRDLYGIEKTGFRL